MSDVTTLFLVGSHLGAALDDAGRRRRAGNQALPPLVDAWLPVMYLSFNLHVKDVLDRPPNFPQITYQELKDLRAAEAGGNYLANHLPTLHRVLLVVDAPTSHTLALSPTQNLGPLIRLIAKNHTQEIKDYNIDPVRLPPFIGRLQKYFAETIQVPLEQAWYSSVLAERWWGTNQGVVERSKGFCRLFTPTPPPGPSLKTLLANTLQLLAPDPGPLQDFLMRKLKEAYVT